VDEDGTAEEAAIGEGILSAFNEKSAGVVMKILDDLLSTLNTEVGVRDIRQGLFHTGVLTRECGLAATLP
jgi:hypothetical protein